MLTDITRESILQSIGEYDKVGRSEFLTRYGYGDARKYFLEVAGHRYPSKAIVGVAHKFLTSGAGPLKSADFSGGEKTVKSLLESFGFKVMVVGATP